MKFEFVRLKAILFSLVMLLTLSVSAQEKLVTGKVTDASGPLPGATVVVVDTKNGVAADVDGNYSIKVAPNSKLTFSFAGYEPQTLTIGSQSVLNVKLAAKTTVLDEVVAVGYGNVKKKDATGSLTTVSSKDFNKGGVNSAQDLIVGKSAGVVITSAGGAPGSKATIRIRGGSSLNASNDPLIIIDGVPLSNTDISGSSNFLSFVNPNDIETFTILKDASSTAIYGSRASNGVILITTKKGTIGKKMSIAFNGNTSVSNAVKFVDVYSGDEIRQIAYNNKSLYGVDSYSKLGSSNTNWQKEIFRSAVSHDYNLSLTGAIKKLPYRVSAGYTDQNGPLKTTEMKRWTGSVSLNPVLLNGDLKLDINAKGMNTDQNFGDDGAINNAVNMDPTQAIYENNPSSAGYFQWANHGANLGTANPVEQLMEADNKANVKRFIGNFQADYKIPLITGLRANLSLAKDYTEGKGHNNRPVTSPSVLTNPLRGRLNDFNGKNYNDLLEFYLNYVKELPNISSKVDATAGYSWQHFKRESFNYTRGIVGVSSPYQMSDSASFATENFLVSFFGRVNYTLLDKYLLTVSVRRDGSSRFTNNKWGTFPSAALAWKVKDETFLKDVKDVSTLKLRIGWGVTGQQDIIDNDYPAQTNYKFSSPGSYYPIGGQFLATLRPNAYDPNIKWEETTTQNIGLDFGFFKDEFNERISGSFDLYKRTTKDLLNKVTVASGSNFSNTLWTNVGSLENKGAEFTLNLVPISKKDMSLNLAFNVTYNMNKVNTFNKSNDPNYFVTYGTGMTGDIQATKVGYPAYSFFMNKQVYDTNGNPIEGLYVDLSGKGGTVNGTVADKYLYKNPAPDYVLGFSARFNYKKFDISASSRANIGNYVYNQVAAGASYDQMYQIGYWKNFANFLSDTKFVKRQFTSDYFVENASFFKLDNLSAGYNFDNVAEHFKVRLSFTVQNVFTITKYKGIDPEVGLTNVNGINVPGIDNNAYPRPRTYMVGLNITY